VIRVNYYIKTNSVIFSLGLGVGRLTYCLSGSHVGARPVGILTNSDQHLATYTIHNKHHRRKSMSSAGFEPAIPVIEAVADIRLRPHGLRDRHSVLYKICQIVKSRSVAVYNCMSRV